MASHPMKFLKIGVLIYLVYALAVVAIKYNVEDASPDEMEWEDRQRFNQIQIGKLDLGTQRQVIVGSLGSPDISEAKQVNQRTLSLLFYRTHHVKSDGITTKDECTPLLFKDGVLVAWGSPAETMYKNESQNLSREST